MNKKKIVILSLIVSFVTISIVLFFIFKPKNSNNIKSEETQNIESKVKDSKDSKKEDKSENDKKEDLSEKKSDQTEKASEQETHTSQTTNSNSNNNYEQPVQQQETQTQVQQSEPQQPVQQQEQPKQSGPWEAFGMSEYDYYNKPMYSWERVDFSSMNECISYGESYGPYLNGEVLYNCRYVTSASGNTLGVMFDTEQLN